ncbi:hypothetical protein SARC_05160 [Sphaeroforma arctica JP610]|uniref:Integrase catalytic domain-containing protein n=1 Tax=Sphaeroforma arctica JP610 TaxID=667725 RepID=A0A0L0G177_9EUKA|nr:hypothetical protein SARC_05160 [Sphaeroforma arctica JP610]KNC82564.1 hypothetical protein SARC_05160 [Sphaeroforma arctica JP610]|eukprot:XP_014156466.1 hypothetical protein SARC_05160 [Sphaeroforma arctica JP610]
MIPFKTRSDVGGVYALSWAFLNLWCNPPWYDLERVFLKVVADRARGITICCPYMPKADWFLLVPDLLLAQSTASFSSLTVHRYFHADFAHFPKAPDGKGLVLIAVCEAAGMVFVRPSSTKSGAQCIDFVCEQLFPWGVPTEFTPHFTGVDQHQGNGQAEVMVNILKAWVYKARIPTDQVCWVRLVHAFAQSYNALVSSVTDAAPYPKATGRPYSGPQLPMLEDRVLHLLESKAGEPEILALDLSEAFTAHAQEAQKAAADKLRLDVPPLREGQQVMSMAQFRRHTLRDQTTDKELTRHRAQLKKYFPRIVDGHSRCIRAVAVL